jgi:hypothetical protein
MTRSFAPGRVEPVDMAPAVLAEASTTRSLGDFAAEPRHSLPLRRPRQMIEAATTAILAMARAQDSRRSRLRVFPGRVGYRRRWGASGQALASAGRSSRS